MPRLAEDLPLPTGASVTQVKQAKGFVTVTALTTASIDDVYVEMQAIMKTEGFTILNAENETTDAEIFFARYADVAGVARLKPGACSGDLSVKVIYDPLDEPADSTAGGG